MNQLKCYILLFPTTISRITIYLIYPVVMTVILTLGFFLVEEANAVWGFAASYGIMVECIVDSFVCGDILAAGAGGQEFLKTAALREKLLLKALKIDKIRRFSYFTVLIWIPLLLCSAWDKAIGAKVGVIVLYSCMMATEIILFIMRRYLPTGVSWAWIWGMAGGVLELGVMMCFWGVHQHLTVIQLVILMIFLYFLLCMLLQRCSRKALERQYYDR